MSPATLFWGVLFVLVGAVAWGATRWLMRTLPGARLTSRSVVAIENERGDGLSEAVIVIQPGGRVTWLNESARTLFDLPADTHPNLEMLARKVRPPELFLGLCAHGGQDLVTLGGRTVEVRVLATPLDGQAYRLVWLREANLASELARESALPAQTLQTFLQLTQAIAASLDLNETLQAVLDSLERLLPADIWEITLWDAEAGVLWPYRRLAGHRLERVPRGYALDEGYSGYLARTRRPLLLSRVEERSDLHQAIDRQSYPLRSYMGVPLIVGKELIGTLELGSLTPDHFQPPDLELLRLISGQAAIAIHHALLYRQEQRRATELAGLAQFAQAFGSVRDPRELFERLINSILPLLPVNILGFLVFNENTRRLEAQAPFIGLPPEFLDMYRVPVGANSPLERALLEQDVLITENAVEDSRWHELGLHHLAVAAGLRETVLVPLASVGRILGYMQASNRLNGGMFTQDEIRLMMIIANQAAPIIENATLVQQSRQRAQRAEALRRIASLASSAATLDEILKYSLQELVRLLRADCAAIFLLNTNRTALELHRFSYFGEVVRDGGVIPRLLVDDPQFPFTVTGSQDALHSGRLSFETTLIPYYQHLRQTWEVESVVVVPLVVRNEGIGEIWVGSRRPEQFDHADLQLMFTAAGQLAGVVEQATLRAQTDETLRQRLEQLTALNRITRELSTSLDLEHLMEIVYEEALRITRADCGSLILFDLQRASQGNKWPLRLNLGEPIPTELGALERQALQTGLPVNVNGEEISSDTVALLHEGITSLLIVPIFYRQYPAGLIHLHARQVNHFGSAVTEVVQSLAAQASVVLSNALQYEEQVQRSELVRRQLETFAELYRVSSFLWPDQSLEDALAAIARAITQATPFRAVLISVYDPEKAHLVRKISRGLTPEQWEEVRQRTLPWSALEAVLRPEFRLDTLYYIPADRTPVLPDSIHWVNVMRPEDELPVTEDMWHPDDLLLAPLYDDTGQPLGLISVDDPSDGRRPDRAALDTLSLFAAQAALVIARHRHLQDLQQRLAHYEALQIEETRRRESLRWRRVREGFTVMEEASRQSSVEGVLRSVAHQWLERLEGMAALIAEQRPSGPHLWEVIGTQPPNLNPQALLGQRNPLLQALNEGIPLMVADVHEEPAWQNSPLLQGWGAQAFLTLVFEPSAGRRIGVLVLIDHPLPSFEGEDIGFYTQFSRQISITLQNLELLEGARRRLHEVNLLLDYSRKLGSLSETDLLQALCTTVLEVIPEAEAAWVALWEPREEVLIPRAVCGYADETALRQVRFAVEYQNDAILTQAFQQGQAVCIDEVNFVRDYALSGEDLLLYRHANQGKLPLSTLVLPLGSGERVLGVLVVENFSQNAVFTPEHQTLAHSLAQQTLLALENARLFQAAGRRLEQLQALTQASARLSASLNEEEAISALMNALGDVITYDTAALWLREGDVLRLVAAQGFADHEQRVGLEVRLEDSRLFQAMREQGQPILVADIRRDERFPRFLEPERLCWLGLPLLVQADFIGVLALEKAEAGYYSSEDVQVGATFASQAALALAKARLLEDSRRRAVELDQRSERLALLYNLSNELGASLDSAHILSLTMQRLRDALGADMGAVLTWEEGKVSLALLTPPEEATLPQPLPNLLLFERLQETRGIYIVGDIHGEMEMIELIRAWPTLATMRSLIMVPLASAQVMQGWVVLTYAQEHRFASPELELARTICNQAAVALQNARLFAETRALKEDLEQRVALRTAELQQANLETQTLLRVITELSASLDIHQVLTRALEVLNQALDVEASLVQLMQGEGFLRMVPDLGLEPKALIEAVKPLHQRVVNQRSPLYWDNLGAREDEETNVLRAIGVQAVLSVPLILGEEVLGSLFLIHRQPGHFREMHIHLAQAIARQMSITLSNAELFGLIRDQAESLGQMVREQQIEASRSRAILEAVADGVMVTDADLRITLFNASAERILGLQANLVLNQSLERFSGLFGEAGHAWVQTIQRWSEQAEAADASETFAGQMVLEDQRVVAIHVAPVFWRDHFLGTVSIFRDVTYQVQVDRLKSEFLANVSHELRTPLTAIKGYVDVMLMGAAGTITESQQRFLRIVKENAERLIRVVNDLLDVSRIEAGRVELNRAAFDLAEVVREGLQAMQARAREESRNLIFELDLAPTLPPVYGDRERVRQIVESLLSNSYHYTPDQGRIMLRVYPISEHEVQVDVRDTGIGIPIEDQPRIFERFYRGNNPLVMAKAGTGLGLALAKILVEMQGGRIWFTSSGIPGEGSTFSFTLPIAER
ncbi:GAF domain-containing protein [Thermanaerothrix sp. 4228-RoL]|uniref:histidine kinase n=1 Tax=Thermanaerothrix solaris TaxID=3058434 RepID=A0ABU3NS36_9CHLR|nr:GAF domain-containing protein [Thermanaerothrix sp. 4228-RoL]MDT8899013.1 GAF domain-containing protein [Thermanaerothrix sp. 4228-RoL]